MPGQEGRGDGGPQEKRNKERMEEKRKKKRSQLFREEDLVNIHRKTSAEATSQIEPSQDAGRKIRMGNQEEKA